MPRFKFVKVIQKKTVYFFPDTVYYYLSRSEFLYLILL